MESEGRFTGVTIVRTLELGVDDPLLILASSVSGQIVRHGVVDLDQSGLFIDDVELVLVRQAMVPSSEFADGLIILVEESGVAVSVAICSIMASLKAKEDVFALVPSLLEIGSPDGKISISGPDEITGVGKDIGCCLGGAVMSAFRMPGKRCH